MTDRERENVVFRAIKSFKSPCHVRDLLISSPTECGFLGSLGQIELATYSDGHTHIGVKDVFNILGDEKEYLCRCNNRVMRCFFNAIESLVNDGRIEFSGFSFKESDALLYTDIGVLETDVQKLYSKYIMGMLR